MAPIADKTERAQQISAEYPEFATPSADAFAVFNTLYKYRRFIRNLFAFALITSLLVVVLIPNRYKSTTKILPPQQSMSSAFAALGQLAGLASLVGKDAGLKNPADMYTGMLKSRTVSDALIRKFELQKVYRDRRMVDTREHLADRTEITSGKDGIISVTVEDKDAQRAAEMANFYIDQLQALMGTLTITEAAHRRKFFEEQVKQEMDRLAEAEVQLKNTQETTGMIQLSDQARAIIQSIAQLRAAIATKEIQLAGLRSFGTEENPSVRLAEQELAALRAQLGKAEKSQTGGSGDIYVATANLPKAGLEYLRKYREVKYHEFVFTELSKQYEMARVEEAKSAPLIQILDRAEPADKKSWPPRSLLLTGLIVLWLLVGCAIVFTYEKLSKLSHDARYRGEVDSIFASPWLERSLHRTHRILQGRA